jgi:hypothetical protein
MYMWHEQFRQVAVNKVTTGIQHTTDNDQDGRSEKNPFTATRRLSEIGLNGALGGGYGSLQLISQKSVDRSIM